MRITPRVRTVLPRIPVLAVGQVLFGTGIALNIRADLGLSPWDAFHQGLALRTPLSVGVVTIVVSAVVLAAWFPLRQRPGLATFMNAIVVGLTIDAVLFLVAETGTLWLRVVYLVVGLGLSGYGSALYIGVRLGPGPRDGIMMGLAARGMSIRLARTIIEGTVLVAGWLLGGSVGIGTVIHTVTIGPLLQFLLRWTDKGPL